MVIEALILLGTVATGIPIVPVEATMCYTGWSPFVTAPIKTVACMIPFYAARFFKSCFTMTPPPHLEKPAVAFAFKASPIPLAIANISFGLSKCPLWLFLLVTAPVNMFYSLVYCAPMRSIPAITVP